MRRKYLRIAQHFMTIKSDTKHLIPLYPTHVYVSYADLNQFPLQHFLKSIFVVLLAFEQGTLRLTVLVEYL